MKNILTTGVLAFAVAACLLPACQDQAWDDHYAQPSGQANRSLLDELRQHTEFSDFVSLLEKSGGDSILSYSQTYTVFAPTNQALAGIAADESTLTQLVKNHVARYIYGPSDLVDTAYVRIKMLNGKYQELTNSNGQTYFAGLPLSTQPIGALNGVIYSLQSKAEYYDNIWELLTNNPERYGSLHEYLSLFNDTTISKSNILVGENSKGQPLYYHNKWMKRYGSIHLEDSLYTAILPTNECWAQAYEQISPYFRTFGQLIQDKTASGAIIYRRTYDLESPVADSLQDIHTREVLAKDLLFRRRPDFIHPVGDTLQTTSGTTYTDPKYLIEGLEPQTASNGTYYSVDRLPHKMSDLVLRPIKVEAESSSGRAFNYATLTKRSAADGLLKEDVSNLNFLEVVNTSTNALFPPQVVFDLKNVMAAKYNIYAVFVPAMAFDTLAIGHREPKTIICQRDTVINRVHYQAGDEATIEYPYYDADSTKVCFYINYVHDKANAQGYNMYEDSKIEKDPDTGEPFITHGYEVTKFLVARNFEFPFANYTASAFTEHDAQTVNTKIRVTTNLSTADKTTMGYTMRIDYLILEPVVE